MAISFASAVANVQPQLNCYHAVAWNPQSINYIRISSRNLKLVPKTQIVLSTTNVFYICFGLNHIIKIKSTLIKDRNSI